MLEQKQANGYQLFPITYPVSCPLLFAAKRQRDQALLSAVKQRAEAGPAVMAVVASGEAGDQFTTTSSLENRVVEFLRTALRELLSTCPFQLPGL